MILLYKIAMFLYTLGISIAALFNPKAKLWVKGRKGIFSKIEREVKGKTIWFHCASLGEFEMARPLIEKVKSEFPDEKIVLTFFSPSGYEVRKNYELADYVYYLPVDTKHNASLFIDLIQPRMAVFAKYEIWHYYLQELKKRNISATLISAVFRDSHRFFKWYGGFFRKDLQCFQAIFVQQEDSGKLLETIHISATVAGDTRFDRVYDHAQQVKELPEIVQFKGEHSLLVLGSSWPVEEQILAKALDKVPLNLKIIIAPHDISASHIRQIEQLFPENVQRYSRFNGETEKRILLIDNIGLLSSVYRYSDYAFIGGGYTGKLHNILESATFGNVILFGPKHERFAEAADLLSAGGAFEVTDNFATIILRLEEDEQLRNDMKYASSQFVFRHKGASEKIWKWMKAQLEISANG